MSTVGRRPGSVDVWWARTGPEDSEAMLRDAVSALVGIPADSVPAVERQPGQRARVADALGVGVSITHSTELLAVAVARRRDVGVDVELIRNGPWERLPDHALTASERAGLARLPFASRTEGFLRLWVRKEAVLKAAGTGLAVDPRLVEVTGADEPARVLDLPPALGEPQSWSLVDFALDHHVGAVAVVGTAPQVRLLPWRGVSALTQSLPPGDEALTAAS